MFALFDKKCGTYLFIYIGCASTLANYLQWKRLVISAPNSDPPPGQSGQ